MSHLFGFDIDDYDGDDDDSFDDLDLMSKGIRHNVAKSFIRKMKRCADNPKDSITLEEMVDPSLQFDFMIVKMGPVIDSRDDSIKSHVVYDYESFDLVDSFVDFLEDYDHFKDLIENQNSKFVEPKHWSEYWSVEELRKGWP